MLFHFYPLSFINTNNVAALTRNVVASMDAEVFFDPVFPSVQESSFANFKIAKDFSLTLCTPDRQHKKSYLSRIILMVGLRSPLN
jgi:hypothetical protein